MSILKCDLIQLQVPNLESDYIIHISYNQLPINECWYVDIKVLKNCIICYIFKMIIIINAIIIISDLLKAEHTPEHKTYCGSTMVNPMICIFGTYTMAPWLYGIKWLQYSCSVHTVFTW